ncbi:MAG: response regulator transcription factor [Bacteroidetes bacterium]|nr:response regulator transcription factor [Bacteroidota bacterium]
MKTPAGIPVIVADDHPIFRSGLRDVLHGSVRYHVVAECADGVEAWNAIRAFNPTVALLDIEMPGMSGLDVAERIVREGGETLVVLLTMHDEREAVERARDLGVLGYILKDDAVTDLIHCLDAVVNGALYISPALRCRKPQLRYPETDRPESDGFRSLTATERRVLRLIAQSRSSAQIAEEMYISIRTVQHHRENISRKLGISGANALVRYAVENKYFFQ